MLVSIPLLQQNQNWREPDPLAEENTDLDAQVVSNDLRQGRNCGNSPIEESGEDGRFRALRLNPKVRNYATGPLRIDQHIWGKDQCHNGIRKEPASPILQLTC